MLNQNAEAGVVPASAFSVNEFLLRLLITRHSKSVVDTAYTGAKPHDVHRQTP